MVSLFRSACNLGNCLPYRGPPRLSSWCFWFCFKAQGRNNRKVTERPPIIQLPRENKHFNPSRCLCPLLYFFLQLFPQIAAPSAFTNSSFSSYRGSPFCVPSMLATGRNFWTKPQALVGLTHSFYFFVFT